MISVSAAMDSLAGVFKRIKAYEVYVSADERSKRALSAARIARNWAVVRIETTPFGNEWPTNRRPSSADGEFPARQSGKMVRSFKTYIERPGVAHWDAGGRAEGDGSVGPGNSSRSIAHLMEFGFSHTHIYGRRKPTLWIQRSFMRPALIERRKEIMAAMKRGKVEVVEYVGLPDGNN